MEHKPFHPNAMTRVALCAAVAVGVLYAVEKLCQGKGYPLWEKYGPWLQANKLQAIAICAAVLYAVSLALWPEEKVLPGEASDGFEACA